MTTGRFVAIRLSLIAPHQECYALYLSIRMKIQPIMEMMMNRSIRNLGVPTTGSPRVPRDLLPNLARSSHSSSLSS